MKKLLIIFIPILAILFVFTYINTISAEEKATKNECIAKVKEAADMIKGKGLHATKQAINDKNGPFVYKGGYVFMLDDVATMLANPKHPLYNVRNVTDSNGKKFFQEMVDLAKTKGEGWVDYMWLKQGGTEPLPRTAFVYKVPGEYVILCAGIYK